MDAKIERLTYYYDMSKEKILECIIQTQKKHPSFKLEKIVDTVFDAAVELYDLPLPLELYGDMIMALPYKDLVKACSVSKQFRRMCRTPEFVIKWVSLASFEDQRKMVVRNIGRWSNELFDQVYKTMILGYRSNKKRFEEGKYLYDPDDNPRFILESMYTLADEAKSIDYEEFKKGDLKKKAQARLKTMMVDYGRFSNARDEYNEENHIIEFYMLTLALILGHNPDCKDQTFEAKYIAQLKQISTYSGTLNLGYFNKREPLSREDPVEDLPLLMLRYIIMHSNKYAYSDNKICIRSRRQRDFYNYDFINWLFPGSGHIESADYIFSSILLIDVENLDEFAYEKDWGDAEPFLNFTYATSI